MKSAFILTVSVALAGLAPNLAFAEKSVSSTAKSDSRPAWFEGLEDIQPAVTSRKDGFQGRTALTSGMGMSSSGLSLFSAGIEHQWSPRWSFFAQTTGTSLGQASAGQTQFGFNYQGLSLGGWEMGFSGAFAPSSEQMGFVDASSRANALLSNRAGYRFSTSIGRDFGDISTYLRFSFQDMPQPWGGSEFGQNRFLSPDPWGMNSLFP